MAEIGCTGKTVREVNAEIKRLIAQGNTNIVVTTPEARHNLGVALLQPASVTFEGSVGYYCAGMIDEPTVVIEGSAGWGVAESMLSGTVIVHGNAGNGAAAAMCGGTVVIYGDAAARAAVSLKGGLVLIAGNCGYMAGFMAQKAMTMEMQMLARACGKADVHDLDPEDLRALTLEASMIAGIPLAGTNRVFGDGPGWKKSH